MERFKFIKRSYGEKVKLGYVGTATGWYDFDRTLQLVKAIGEHVDYHFTIYNGGQHEFIKQKLKEYDIPDDKITLKKVDFADMPQALEEIEIAVFYIHPYFSKRASAATKLGEFFASGIPVFTNGNVGDHEYYISQYKTGKILDFEALKTYDFKMLTDSLRNESTALRCRALAEKDFSVSEGVKGYKEIYSQIFTS